MPPDLGPPACRIQGDLAPPGKLPQPWTMLLPMMPLSKMVHLSGDPGKLLYMIERQTLFMPDNFGFDHYLTFPSQ